MEMLLDRSRAGTDRPRPRVATSHARSEREQARRRLARSRMRELAIAAASGCGMATIASRFRLAFQDAMRPPATARERLELAGELLQGLCASARWFDPRRTTAVVPPLCIVLLQVGRPGPDRRGPVLCIDIVLPAGSRRVEALTWAHDVRLLLMDAGVAHHVETVQLADGPIAGAVAHGASSGRVAWGCQSLFVHYLACDDATARRRLRDPSAG